MSRVINLNQPYTEILFALIEAANPDAPPIPRERYYLNNKRVDNTVPEFNTKVDLNSLSPIADRATYRYNRLDISAVFHGLDVKLAQSIAVTPENVLTVFKSITGLQFEQGDIVVTRPSLDSDTYTLTVTVNSYIFIPGTSITVLANQLDDDFKQFIDELHHFTNIELPENIHIRI